MNTSALFLVALCCLISSCASRPASPSNPSLRVAADAQPVPESYVPEELQDAHDQLLKILRPETIDQMKQGTEEEMVRFHHGLGTWIRNNWQLWRGGRLAKYFNSLGIYHPDDMSGIILDTFWCRLNEQPFRLDERITYYQEYWRQHKEPENKTCPKDGTQIVITRWLYDPTPQRKYVRVVHAGRCKKKHWWAYEVDRSWYEPDEALMKRINGKGGATRIR